MERGRGKAEKLKAEWLKWDGAGDGIRRAKPLTFESQSDRESPLLRTQTLLTTDEHRWLHYRYAMEPPMT